jgi:hypothetical protein
MILTSRCVAFMDLAKGGWIRIYEIRDGEKIVGKKTMSAQTRGAPQKVVYAIGDERFDTAKDFIAAYKRQQAEAA